MFYAPEGRRKWKRPLYNHTERPDIILTPKALVWDTLILSNGSPITLRDVAFDTIEPPGTENSHIYPIDTIIPTDEHIGIGDYGREYKLQYLPFIRKQSIHSKSLHFTAFFRTPIHVLEINGTEVICTETVEILIYQWGFLPVKDITYQHQPVLFNNKTSILRKDKIDNKYTFKYFDNLIFSKSKLHDVDYSFRWVVTNSPGSFLLANGMVVR